MPSNINVAAWVHSYVLTTPAYWQSNIPPVSKKRRSALADMTDQAVNNPQTPKRPRRDKTDVDYDIDPDSTPTQPGHPHPTAGSYPSPASRQNQLPEQPQNSSFNADLSSLQLDPTAPYFGGFNVAREPRKRQADDSVSESSGRSSKASKRSLSPQKELAARQEAKYPVQELSFKDWDDLPPAVQVIAQYMQDLKDDAEGILPAGWRNIEELSIALKEGDSRAGRRFAQLFSKESDTPIPLSLIRELVNQSRENKSRVVSEAHWNCTVHWPLLKMAVRNSSHGSSVDCDNVTSASILKELVPNTSRKVDFCLSIRLDSTTRKRFNDKNIFNLSHTDYYPLHHNLIGPSVETKPDIIGVPEAKLQVATWGEAHIAQLRILLAKAHNPNAAIPPIPMLLVLGHQWYLWCFHDGGVSLNGFSKGARFFCTDGIEFGDTWNVLGCYKTIAGVQYLVRWMETVWMPWWKTEILDRL